MDLCASVCMVGAARRRSGRCRVCRGRAVFERDVEEVVSAAALAIPLWAMLEVIVVPLAGGQPPAWTNVGMRALFPSLIGWIGFGCALGLMLHAVRKFAPLAAGSPNAAANRAPARIVILGGGFAGMTTAAKLERALGADRLG